MNTKRKSIVLWFEYYKLDPQMRMRTKLKFMAGKIIEALLSPLLLVGIWVDCTTIPTTEHTVYKAKLKYNEKEQNKLL